MVRKREDILAKLKYLPWWISICIGAFVYAGCKSIIPSLNFESMLLKAAAKSAPKFSWLAFLFLFPAVYSFLNTTRKRRMLENQSGIDSIRSLSWKEFEELLAESYRRQGYSVQENNFKSADGGVDITMRKNGNLYLVQCKQWLTFKIGVKVVREMFGIMTAQNAKGVIIVTSGVFTQEARNFASGKPIELIDGNKLVEIIRSVQKNPVAAADGKIKSVVKICPHCGMNLVLREAKRGSNAGGKFLGCSAFPRCRYTEKYNILDKFSKITLF